MKNQNLVESLTRISLDLMLIAVVVGSIGAWVNFVHAQKAFNVHVKAHTSLVAVNTSGGVK